MSTELLVRVHLRHVTDRCQRCGKFLGPLYGEERCACSLPTRRVASDDTLTAEARALAERATAHMKLDDDTPIGQRA